MNQAKQVQEELLIYFLSLYILIFSFNPACTTCMIHFFHIKIKGHNFFVCFVLLSFALLLFCLAFSVLFFVLFFV